MAETIHFGEKFRTALAKYFASRSVTEHAFNHNIDAEFSGSDTVHILEIATNAAIKMAAMQIFLFFTVAAMLPNVPTALWVCPLGKL